MNAALKRAPALALLLFVLSFANACAAGGGAKALIEDLIELSAAQADILDSISDAVDLKKTKGKINEFYFTKTTTKTTKN